MAKITITLEVDDLNQKILYNELFKSIDGNEGIKDWCEKMFEGKLHKVWKRMQREWTTKLMDDNSFTDSIPSNKSDFITLVTSRSDYKNRTDRDAD